jgi:hypothetical protein
MLKIKEGEPWVMWPDNMVSNFIDFPANRIFDYDGNFYFMLVFELPHLIERKSTLFAKLPTYFGVDLEPDGLTFILTDIGQVSTYRYCSFKWVAEKRYKLYITKNKSILSLYIDDMLMYQEYLTRKLGADPNSHIIFGAGNFPKNGFNLNYLDVNLIGLHIHKEDDYICGHTFDTFTHNKSFDLTNNCNFINKI